MRCLSSPYRQLTGHRHRKLKLLFLAGTHNRSQVLCMLCRFKESLSSIDGGSRPWCCEAEQRRTMSILFWLPSLYVRSSTAIWRMTSAMVGSEPKFFEHKALIRMRSYILFTKRRRS
jgi:hypothetical protein